MHLINEWNTDFTQEREQISTRNFEILRTI